MVRQESNFNIQQALTKILDTKYSKLVSFNVQMQSMPQMYTGVNGPPFGMYVGTPNVTLDLVFYMDQILELGKDDSFSILERALANFLSIVDGQFVNRAMHHNAHEVMCVNYKIQLHDYERFTSKLEDLFRKLMDAEFTAALESKLSEP